MSSNAQSRLHFMDNLRALAMLAGVLIHSCMAYSPLLSNVWLTSNPDNSRIIDVLFFFLHLFRMPLFFLVAGFFAALLMHQRGPTEMLKNRFKRIFLPFIVFLPLCTMLVFFLVNNAYSHVENLPPILQTIAEKQNSPESGQELFFSTMHLWFLYLLSYLYLLYWALSRFNLSWLTKALSGAKDSTVLICMPVSLVPFFLLTSAPHPAPESLLPSFWGLGLFGIFFAFGTWLYLNKEFIEKLRRYWVAMLLASITLYLAFYAQLPDQALEIQSKSEFAYAHLLMCVLEAYTSFFMTMVCVYLGHRFLSAQNRIMSFLAKSSYWVYIIHLPVLLGLQFHLIDLSWSVWIKVTLSVSATLLISFLTYILFIRRTFIGTFLNGKRRYEQRAGR